MKKPLFLLTALIGLFTANAQGVKRQLKPSHTAATQQPADSVLKGVSVSDTQKVIVTLLVEDGTKSWFRGYVVTKYFLPKGFSNPATSQTLFDDKWKVAAYATDDIDNIRQVKWK